MHLNHPWLGVVRNLAGSLRGQLPVEVALGDERYSHPQHPVGYEEQQADCTHSDLPRPVLVSEAQCLLEGILQDILFEQGHVQVLGKLPGQGRLPRSRRACNSLTPFRCPHAVHPCPSVDSGLGVVRLLLPRSERSLRFRVKPIFPVLGVFRLKEQSKRDSGNTVRSCKAIQRGYLMDSHQRKFFCGLALRADRPVSLPAPALAPQVTHHPRRGPS